MKKIILVILFISSLNVLSQETKVFTKNVSGTNANYRGLTYQYKATIKFKLLNAGLNDIKIKVGVTNFTVTNVFGKIDNKNIEVDYFIKNELLPYKNAAKQFDISGEFLIFPSGNYGARKSIDFSIGMVRDGDLLDSYYLTGQQVKEVSAKYNLKNDKNQIKNFELQLINFMLLPEGLPILNKIINATLEKNNSKNAFENKLKKLKSERKPIYNNDVSGFSLEKINEQIPIYQELINLENLYPEAAENSKENFYQYKLYLDALKERKKQLSNSKNTKVQKKKKPVKKKTKKQLSAEEWARNQKIKATNLYAQYKRTYNYKDKQTMLRELSRMSSYLPPNERATLNKDIRKYNRERVTSNVTNSLTNVDYGNGMRRVLLYAATGFNYIYGDNSNQSELSFPMLKLGAEISFPVSRTLTIDVFGEYNHNFFLDLGGFLPEDDSTPNYLNGVDLSGLEKIEITEETKLSRSFYGVGVTLGRSRKFGLALLAQNINYQYTKTEEGKSDINIGQDKSIATFGLGASYDFQGKDKQEFGRLSASYTINDKNISFLNSDYENNEYSNINVKFETGFGALYIGFEYNMFNDAVREESFSTIGLRGGYKFGG